MGGPENLKRGSIRPSVRPSVRPIHFSSANQIRVFLFSANREPPLIPGGRFDWLCNLPSLISVDQLERGKQLVLVTHPQGGFQANKTKNSGGPRAQNRLLDHSWHWSPRYLQPVLPANWAQSSHLCIWSCPDQVCACC